MVAQSGSLMLLKVANNKGNHVVVGGMRTTKFILNNQSIDITHKESGKWRHLLGSAGISSLNISGSGVFTDQKSEAMVREIAFANNIASFKITFGNGDILGGPFIISTYERSGTMFEEENYNLTLESAGSIHYIGKHNADKGVCTLKETK